MVNVKSWLTNVNQKFGRTIKLRTQMRRGGIKRDASQSSNKQDVENEVKSLESRDEA